jgi:hypothetical protein
MSAAALLLLDRSDVVFLAKTRHGLGVFLTHSELATGQKIPLGYRYSQSPVLQELNDHENIRVLDFPGFAFLDTDFGCAINHSSTPRGKFVWTPHPVEGLLPFLWYEAISRIRIGQQLTLDYGPEYSQPDFST